VQFYRVATVSPSHVESVPNSSGMLPHMEDVDVWRPAHHMMKRYGDDAALRATKRADALQAAGDREGAQIWRRIASAIGDLEREKPSDSQPLI